MNITKRFIYIISICSTLFLIGLILLLYFFVIKKPKGTFKPNQLILQVFMTNKLIRFKFNCYNPEELRTILDIN